MNTNIASLQTIIGALEEHDYITSVTPIYKEGVEIGYTITFAQSGAITIYHGQDGKNGLDGKDGHDGTDGKDGQNGKDGQDGKDGVDGKDGHSPEIGVAKDVDGIYYWTIDGTWLLDENGCKIKAEGTDGKDGKDGQDGQNGAPGANGTDGKDGQDGKDGKDGITPQLKIENDYWYVSYDNGVTWIQLYKAIGTDASIFSSVTETENSVVFTLADGTVLTVLKETALDITFDESNLSEVKTNSEVKVNYQVSTSAQNVTIEALPTNDLRAEVVASDNTKKSGYILIRTGSTFDAASRVVVLVSDGNKAIMKSIALNIVADEVQTAQLYIYNGAVKNVTSAGGNVTLSFLTNVECEAVIPAEGQSWISLVNTRALEYKSITLAVAENNNSDRRSCDVVVRSTDGKLSITYTIAQIGASSSSNPEVGDDGTILGTPAANEIYYTTSSGKAVTFYSATPFNGVVLSNTYANGVGVIVLDRPCTAVMDYAFQNNSTLVSIVLPEGITTIGDYAFYNSYSTSKLKSVTLPNSLKSIGTYAFDGCKSLSKINIPNSVTSIGTYVFSGCSSLVSIEIPNNVTYIGSYAFYSCSSLVSIEISNSVTSIGINAFNGCSSLVSIEIPNSVTSIGGKAFKNCSSLANITIGNKVSSIGYNCFEGCTSLTTITIPDATKTISIQAFYGCSSLREIKMGSGVKSIESQAFGGCYYLKDIYCKAATPPTGHSQIFASVALDAKVYVPSASVEAYKATEYWSDYSSLIVGYDFE